MSLVPKRLAAADSHRFVAVSPAGARARGFAGLPCVGVKRIHRNKRHYAWPSARSLRIRIQCEVDAEDNAGSRSRLQRIVGMIPPYVQQFRNNIVDRTAAAISGEETAGSYSSPQRMISTPPRTTTAEDTSLHPVLAVLAARAQSNSRPGRRQDPYKVGLVVQGGGMRGVVSGGGLTALLDLGMRDLFDATYGSSAGAMNLTYFLAGQPEGARAYVDDLASGAFLDLRRLSPSKKIQWRNEPPPRPALDLSVLLDDVMGIVKPLNWDAIINSHVPLKVVASDLDLLKSVLLEDFESVRDLKKCLKASAAVPALATSAAVEHRGLRLVDAAVFEGIPLPSAIADGCTHVLVLSTVSRGAAQTERGGIGQAAAKVLERAVKQTVLNPPYMKGAWKREAEMEVEGTDEASMAQLLLAASAHPTDEKTLGKLGGTSALCIYPDEELLGGSNLGPLSCDKLRLEQGLQAGTVAVYDAMEPINNALVRRPFVVAAKRAVVSLISPLVGSRNVD